MPALETAARGRRVVLRGEPQSPIDPPADACRFHARCPDAVERCGREAPVPRLVGEQAAACHFAFEGEAIGHPAGG